MASAFKPLCCRMNRNVDCFQCQLLNLPKHNYGDVGQVETLDPVCPNVKAGTSVPVEFLKVKGAS